ncbi:MAG: carbonate dehydratase [Betaproteobacteria bacterium]
MSIQKLLENNREWSAAAVAKDPQFFSRLSAQQAPSCLWIGCADSRVPANEIVGLLPGELFVHRNLANVVVHTDLNCLSVIEFAVDLLHVKDIIVCGHYGCSGVQAALARSRIGLSDNWLRHVQDVYDKHERGMVGLQDVARRHDRLCELNVLEQVMNVCGTTVLQDAWTRGDAIEVHGLIYSLKDGRLRDLGMAIKSPDEARGRYEEALSRLDKTATAARS